MKFKICAAKGTTAKQKVYRKRFANYISDRHNV